MSLLSEQLLSTLLGFFLPLLHSARMHTSSRMFVINVAANTVANSTTAAVTSILLCLELLFSFMMVGKLEVTIGVV